jgi:HPt (histidine-containing phosphotransfer) domain-containing protein
VLPEGLAQRLASIQGFAFERALQNVGGELPLLERVLRRFVQTYRIGLPDLLAVPDASQIPVWKARLHSLLGACTAVGAADLTQDIRDLDRRLDSEADTEELARRGEMLDAGLRDLVGRLEERLGRSR